MATCFHKGGPYRSVSFPHKSRSGTRGDAPTICQFVTKTHRSDEKSKDNKAQTCTLVTPRGRVTSRKIGFRLLFTNWCQRQHGIIQYGMKSLNRWHRGRSASHHYRVYIHISPSVVLSKISSAMQYPQQGNPKRSRFQFKEKETYWSYQTIGFL